MMNKNDIKELMEKVHNDNKLSSIEKNNLDNLGFSIENNGKAVELIEKGKVLVSIPYYTVGSPTSNEWDKFDKEINQLSI